MDVKKVLQCSMFGTVLVITLSYLVAPKGAVLFNKESSHFTSWWFSWRWVSWRAFWPRVSSLLSWRQAF